MFRSMLSIAVLVGVTALSLFAETITPERPIIRSAAYQSSIHGQIVTVHEKEMVVSVGGEFIHFLIAGDAQITVNGRPADVSDLQPRHMVVIFAETKGRKPVAKWISATEQLWAG